MKITLETLQAMRPDLGEPYDPALYHLVPTVFEGTLRRELSDPLIFTAVCPEFRTWVVARWKDKSHARLECIWCSEEGAATGPIERILTDHSVNVIRKALRHRRTVSRMVRDQLAQQQVDAARNRDAMVEQRAAKVKFYRRDWERRGGRLSGEVSRMLDGILSGAIPWRPAGSNGPSGM